MLHLLIQRQCGSEEPGSRPSLFTLRMWMQTVIWTLSFILKEQKQAFNVVTKWHILRAEPLSEKKLKDLILLKLLDVNRSRGEASLSVILA